MLTNKIFKTSLSLLFLFVLQISLFAQKSYQYETISGDPFAARIYTLNNGLKVYFSVQNEEPRIQTFVAVRVGSKNDPAETTGLAHYFEHMMFKGTPNLVQPIGKKKKALSRK